jgi:DNA-binding SARP family transcriptional activator
MPEEPAGLRLTLLGGFQCICQGSTIPLPLGSQRLLALLALQRVGIHRMAAGESLWPDSSPPRAAGNLRSALWRCKRIGDTTAICTAGSQLRLASAVCVDLQQVRSWCCQLSHPRPSRDAAEKVTFLVEMLSRQLLPNWSDDWLFFERERWHQFRLCVLENLAAQLQIEGRYLDALQTALAAIALEPIREAAHRLVIQVHIAEGNTASALKHYVRYREFLQRELGVVPSPRMDQLITSLKQP